MLKNVQLKIILIFGILGIVLISAFGTFYIMNIKTIDPYMIFETAQEIEHYKEAVSTQVQNIKIVTIILLCVYGLISILI